jgi:hypothetical protein
VSREQCQHQLESPLLRGDLPYATRRSRRIGLVKVLDWLQAQPGQTWQARWMASGAQTEPGTDWRRLVTGANVKDPRRACADLGPGLSAMICADMVWPTLAQLIIKNPDPLMASVDGDSFRLPEGLASGPLLTVSPSSLGWPAQFRGDTSARFISFSRPGKVQFHTIDWIGQGGGVENPRQGRQSKPHAAAFSIHGMTSSSMSARVVVASKPRTRRALSTSGTRHWASCPKGSS